MNILPVLIEDDATPPVSGLLQGADGARACFVLAHGAGAGMTHRSMAALADGLAKRRIATLRYQFPFMQQGSRRPDRPALAHATVRAAVATAIRLLPGQPLFAGGKSFGGRMTSQAQAEAALPDVLGLGFVGFPLHPAGKPSDERAAHLSAVRIPMLFVQGTRDALAETGRLLAVAERLGPLAEVRLIEAADHSLHVPARSGRSDPQALDEALDALAGWMAAVVERGAGGG